MALPEDLEEAAADVALPEDLAEVALAVAEVPEDFAEVAEADVCDEDLFVAVGLAELAPVVPSVTVGCTVTDCVPEANEEELATMTEVGVVMPEAGLFLIKVKVSPSAASAPWMYSMLRTVAL